MAMNIKYLDTLPEVANKYHVDLLEGEKVVFTPRPSMFGTEKDLLLGAKGMITLTNKRLIANTGAGVFTNDIQEITGCTRVKEGFIFKADYFLVTISEAVWFDNNKEYLQGYHFYFKRSDAEKFEEIMNSLLR
jgi:hypothetical protein